MGRDPLPCFAAFTANAPAGVGLALEPLQRDIADTRTQTQIRTAAIEGTGLGLNLVKNIVQRHQGEMIFESASGEGSTFGFKLPLVGGEATTYRHSEGQFAQSENLQRVRKVQ